MSEGLPAGVLLLDKPPGISSFQALRPVKRLFPKTRIGHAGTLDPAASGLLLIGIGSATRLLEYLEGMPKTYSFLARFGLVSDSYDMEGAVEPHPGGGAEEDLDPSRIENALEAFCGRIRQIPPVYSAIKIGGERACDRVRAGETVTLESREVTVHSLRLISFSRAGTGNRSGGLPPPAPAASDVLAAGGVDAAGVACASNATFEMTCSKGTYVRSLVHDLGASLGCGAVTDKIRRIAIGPFRVEDAVTPEALASGAALRSYPALLPMEAAVAHLPAAVIPAEWVARFLKGQALALAGGAAVMTAMADDPAHAPAGGAPVPGSEYRALDDNGRLLAIATLSPQGMLCPRKVLAKG